MNETIEDGATAQARWTTLREHVGRRGTLASGDPSWCGLVVDRDGSSHRVVLKPALDQYLIVAVCVCWSDHLFAETALRYNAAAEHGMLTLEDDVYVLRQVLRIDQTAVDEVDAIVDAMVGEAARLRAQLAHASRVDPVDNPFAFLAE